MTKRDIAGELENYAMLITSCDSEKLVKDWLSDLRDAIPGWKKDLEMDERKVK